MTNHTINIGDLVHIKPAWVESGREPDDLKRAVLRVTGRSARWPGLVSTEVVVRLPPGVFIPTSWHESNLTAVPSPEVGYL